MQILTGLFGRTSGYPWVCIICLCGMNLSGGETTLPGDLGRCKTETKNFNQQVTYQQALSVPCGWFGWWRCTQYRKRTKEGTTVQYRTVQICFNSSTTPTDAGDQSDGSGLSGPTGTPRPEVYVPILVVCSLILTTIVIVAAICFRNRRQRRKKKARVANSGQLDSYVEPDVIRERKRAGITRGEHDDSRDQPNSIEFALTNRSPSFTKDGEDDHTTESQLDLYVGLEVIGERKRAGITRDEHDDSRDQPNSMKFELTNRSPSLTKEGEEGGGNTTDIETSNHVKDDDSNRIQTEHKIYANQNFQSATNYDHVILSQNETCNEDVNQNDKEARQSNPDGYDHIMEVKIT